MTINVDRLKCKCWDFKDYMKSYAPSNNRNNYSILKGAPLLLNIEGTYVEITSLINAVNRKNKAAVENYIKDLLIGNIPKYIEWRFKR